MRLASAAIATTTPQLKGTPMTAPPHRTGPDRTGLDRVSWSSAEAADATLAYLATSADNGLATASTSDICDAVDIGAGTAKRAIRRLLDEHRIELLRRGTGGKYRSTYRVLAHADRRYQPVA